MYFYNVILVSKSITWVFLEMQKIILMHPGEQRGGIAAFLWLHEMQTACSITWHALCWGGSILGTWQKMTALPDWPRVAWYFVLLFSGTLDNWLVCKSTDFTNACNISTPIALFITHTYYFQNSWYQLNKQATISNMQRYSGTGRYV